MEYLQSFVGRSQTPRTDPKKFRPHETLITQNNLRTVFRSPLLFCIKFYFVLNFQVRIYLAAQFALIYRSICTLTRSFPRLPEEFSGEAVKDCEQRAKPAEERVRNKAYSINT